MREVTSQNETKPGWAGTIGAFMDRCVYAVAPEWGARRIAQRKRLDLALSAYEGASSDYTRGNAWMGSRLSPVSEQELDLATLRQRSRELYRNDSFGGAVDNRVNHVVGTGFTPQCRISEAIVGREAARTFTAELEEIYKRWSARVDISGQFSLWQQCRLVDRHWAVDGEGIAILSDDPTLDGPIPLVVEVIDPERLETPPSLIGNPRCRLGVERDDRGRIIAYHIRRTHPNDTVELSMEYDRVPASRVLHVFERWFAGQLRGLPWLTRALNRVKDAKDLDEAEIIACQVQACFAAFVKTPLNAQTAAAAAASSSNNGLRHQDIRPGAIQYMNAEEELVFANPSRPGGTYQPFQEFNYRRIAAAINMPFELFIKNWSGVSFAGGRLILNEWRLDTKSRQKLIIEQLLDPVWNRMVDEAVMLGQCSIEPRLWQARPWVYHAHSWTPPAWSYAITPGEEVKANIEAVRHNQKTLADVVAENGGDLEEVLDQREREMQMQRERDIVQADTSTENISIMEDATDASNQ